MFKLLEKSPFKIIQIATICVFAGRAYQHLFWDAPYREIFWAPNWTGGIISTFTSLSWEEYVTHPSGDVWIQQFVITQGWFYVVCALLAVFARRLPRWTWFILLFGALDLVLLAVCYLKDHFYHLGQFLEYSLQFSSPAFLFFLLKNGQPSKSLITVMKIMIVLTFTCHGLYALGYYPRPGTFFTMTENILGIGAEGAIKFLNVAGVLDFIVAIGIFLPWKWARFALGYAVFWGLATSVARLVGNFYWEYPIECFHAWTHEMILRAPHFLVPLYVLTIGEIRNKAAA